MIDSVDRIVTTPVRECPLLVEGVLGQVGAVVRTHWFTIEPVGDDWFLLTDADNGMSLQTRGDTMVQWLKPEDMNSPAIQAELIVGLAQMGIEL
jgi:hypothetical protein